MKNKLELISKAFMVYKIKQHIEYLRELVNQKENKTNLRQLDPSSNKESSHISNNNEPANEEYDQDYLDRNDLAIGMNWYEWTADKEIPADIEKKLGHSLSSI